MLDAERRTSRRLGTSSGPALRCVLWWTARWLSAESCATVGGPACTPTSSVALRVEAVPLAPVVPARVVPSASTGCVASTRAAFAWASRGTMSRSSADSTTRTGLLSALATSCVAVSTTWSPRGDDGAEAGGMDTVVAAANTPPTGLDARVSLATTLPSVSTLTTSDTSS